MEFNSSGCKYNQQIMKWGVWEIRVTGSEMSSTLYAQDLILI